MCLVPFGLPEAMTREILEDMQGYRQADRLLGHATITNHVCICSQKFSHSLGIAPADAVQKEPNGLFVGDFLDLRG
jgi:hypothetical protein